MVSILRNFLLILLFCVYSVAQILTVPNGGTGATTFPVGQVLMGNGVNALTSQNLQNLTVGRASALTSFPMACPAGQYISGFDASGNAQCGTPSGGGGGGIATGGTSPFVISNGSNTLTLTVPTTGNPSLVSSTGSIDINSLFVSNLAGTGVSCLQADALGNVSRTGAACGTGTGGGGGTGWGNVVPNPFTTISAAIAAGGPVIVLPTSTDNTPFTNPSGIRIQNFKQDAAGQDSLFFRDVSEFGPAPDGKVSTCNVTVQGATTLVCSLVFTTADIGKTIMFDQVGPPTGQISGTMAVASTAQVTAPGPPNSTQGVIFNDAASGCNTMDSMPYAYVQLDATGMPSGNLTWSGNWYGKGCTAPPTTGTVTNVTGTVTFSGGTTTPGDFITTITNVDLSTVPSGYVSVTVAAAPLTTHVGSVPVIYGTDVHDTFQAACNGMAPSGVLTSGTLTFSGIALVSHGIDCNSAGLHILGRGYTPLNTTGAGSTIVYIGKTPNPPPNIAGNNPTAYVLNLSGGGGAKLERVGIRGNTQAMPHGLILSFGTNGQITAPGSGAWINQMGVVDQVWFGDEWHDAYAFYSRSSPRLQTCIMAFGPAGNNDFWTFDHIYCVGADVGMDSVNQMAVNFHINKWQSTDSNIGLTLTGGTIEEYYTERNRLDFSIGSPYWAGGQPTSVHIIQMDGESSAMTFEIPESAKGLVSRNSINITCDWCSLGGPASFRRPDGVTGDFTTMNVGVVHWTGNFGSAYTDDGGGHVLMNYISSGGGLGGPDMEFNGVDSSHFRFLAGAAPVLTQSAWDAIGNNLKLTGPNLDMKIPGNYSTWLTNLQPTPGSSLLSLVPPRLLDVERKSQVLIGSLNLQSATTGFSNPLQSYGINSNVICNGTSYNNNASPCGNQTYHYELTCSDSLGNESAAFPHYSGGAGTQLIPNTGPAVLNTTNYIRIWLSSQRIGCVTYNVYGDNGVGGVVGWLASVPIDQITNRPGGSGTIINDQGQYSKNVSRPVPTVDHMGSLKVAGTVQMTQFPNAVSLATDANGYIIPGTGTGTGGPVYTFASKTLQMVTTGGSNLTPIPMTGPGCVNDQCTMVTPSVDTTYTLRGYIAQVTAGTGGTCTATNIGVSLQLRFVDSNNVNNLQNPQTLQLLQNGVAGLQTIANMGSAMTGTSNWSIIPRTFRNKGGQSAYIQLIQPTNSDCIVPPTFEVRAGLFQEAF